MNTGTSTLRPATAADVVNDSAANDSAVAEAAVEGRGQDDPAVGPAVERIRAVTGALAAGAAVTVVFMPPP